VTKDDDRCSGVEGCVAAKDGSGVVLSAGELATAAVQQTVGWKLSG
jgi:hypothetical protein